MKVTRPPLPSTETQELLYAGNWFEGGTSLFKPYLFYNLSNQCYKVQISVTVAQTSKMHLQDIPLKTYYDLPNNQHCTNVENTYLILKLFHTHAFTSYV